MVEHYVFVLVDNEGRLIDDRAYEDRLRADQRRVNLPHAEVRKVRVLK